MESSTSTSSSCRHTCLMLQFPSTHYPHQIEPIFVKGTWFTNHFSLSITDGRDAWICVPSEDDVRERATQWDQPVKEYIELGESYLGFRRPGSVYGFSDAGNGSRRLSLTFEKEGIKMEWRWRCKPSPDIWTCKYTTKCQFVSIWTCKYTSEVVVRKTQAFDLLKEEAEKCLAQSERLSREKDEFESEVYAKFVSVLNSKKAKLGELRQRLSDKGPMSKSSEHEQYSIDKRIEPCNR